MHTLYCIARAHLWNAGSYVMDISYDLVLPLHQTAKRPSMFIDYLGNDLAGQVCIGAESLCQSIECRLNLGLLSFLGGGGLS
jgi:hypothetical protein